MLQTKCLASVIIHSCIWSLNILIVLSDEKKEMLSTVCNRCYRYVPQSQTKGWSGMIYVLWIHLNEVRFTFIVNKKYYVWVKDHNQYLLIHDFTLKMKIILNIKSDNTKILNKKKNLRWFTSVRSIECNICILEGPGWV